MSQALEETMRRFVNEVINKADFSVLKAVAQPDYVFRSPGQELHGLESLKDLLTMYRTAFPDLHVEIDDLVVADDKAAMSFALTGRHEGDLMGIAATGRQVRVDGMTLSRFEGGRIAGEWEILDQLTLLRQLGVVPPPA